MVSTRMLLLPVMFACASRLCTAETKEARSLLDVVRERGSALQGLREAVRSYGGDGRHSIVDLYRAQCDLQERAGWVLEEIFREEITLPDGGRVVLPSNCLRTVGKGPALWILTGIHGEEPAGPNALAESLAVLVRLAKKGIPLIVMPLLNPLGYQRNWRYPDAALYSETNPGSSVGDSDHLLPDERGNPRRPAPACRQAGLLTAKVLELTREYPPLLTVDLHEDNKLAKGYLYSQGRLGAGDPIAREIVALFLRHQFPIVTQGTTRFGEAVKDGIVADVKDGSIDELLSAPLVVVNRSLVRGPAGISVLVVETSAMGVELAVRKKVHAAVITALESCWEIAQASRDANTR